MPHSDFSAWLSRATLRRHQNEDDLKNEDDFKNDDNLKNEEDLKNEDDLKNEYDLKNEADLKIEADLKNWPIPQKHPSPPLKKLPDIFFDDFSL